MCKINVIEIVPGGMSKVVNDKKKLLTKCQTFELAICVRERIMEALRCTDKINIYIRTREGNFIEPTMHFIEVNGVSLFGVPVRSTALKIVNQMRKNLH